MLKNSWAGFWRPPPGGARGQLPPLATPLFGSEGSHSLYSGRS